MFPLQSIYHKTTLDNFTGFRYNTIFIRVKFMNNIQQLVDIISDAIDGPYEGSDFSIDSEGFIQVEETKTAALIMRRVNHSGVFSDRLVRIGRKGDSVLLAFDTLAAVEPVYTSNIGYQKSVLAEVKQDTSNKFCVYLDGRRLGRQFGKLSSVKSWLKKHDQELQSLGETVATYEDIEF